MHEDERVLTGGMQTDVSEAGGIVYRSAGPQSTTVVALLRHLRSVGFTFSPEPVGEGFSDDGREMLGFIEGESPQPHAWSDEAITQIGRRLRKLHLATASFEPQGAPNWRPWFARDLPGDRPVIGHGDLGPWNILARDKLPVAFIDWDNAGPVDAVWELAHVGWLNAQLHDDDVAILNALPDAAQRARQLGLLLDGYGLADQDREGFVDKMVEVALRSARQEAIDYEVTTDSPAHAPDGFPVMWAVTWRTRAAAWMLDNRDLLTNAIR